MFRRGARVDGWLMIKYNSLVMTGKYLGLVRLYFEKVYHFGTEIHPLRPIIGKNNHTFWPNFGNNL